MKHKTRNTKPRARCPRYGWRLLARARRSARYLVAGLDVLRAPRLRDGGDALGGAAGEDDFVGTAGIDELGSTRTRGLEGGGGAIAQFMDAAVDIGIVVLVVIAQGIEHSARLLRGGGIVKVNQRLAVDLLVEDGKVGPDGCPVNHLLLLLRRGCFSDHNHFRAAPTVAWPVRSSCPGSRVGPRPTPRPRRPRPPGPALYSAHPGRASAPCRNPGPSKSSSRPPCGSRRLAA